MAEFEHIEERQRRFIEDQRMFFVGERDTLWRWIAARGEDGLRQHWAENNALSIDGKPTGILATGA